MRNYIADIGARRFQEKTLKTRIYKEPPKQPTSTPASSAPSTSAPSQPQEQAPQDETLFAEPPKDVEPAEVMGSRKAPSPEDLENMKDTLSSFYNRWVEECQGASKLNGLTWAEFCPREPATEQALRFIWERGHEFVQEFQNECCRAYNVTNYPRQLRPWVAETEWTLQRMAMMGWLPRSLLHPRDRAIRKPANEGGDEFLDPGNLSLEMFVYIFRLWKYCDTVGYDATIRVHPDEYGSKPNRSSKGPVNLRGNIVEAMSRDLQVVGSWANPWPWRERAAAAAAAKGFRKGSGRSSSWGPSR